MILILSILFSSTAVFCMVIGNFAWQNMVMGLALSGGLTYMLRQQVVPRPLPPLPLAAHLLIYAPVLIYYLFIDIVKGTWQVATTTLGFEPLHKPGIIKYPIPTSSPYGAGPVGYFITLSPGSFLVDIDWDEKVLLVHVLDASDPDALRRDAEKYFRLWEWNPSSRRDFELPTSSYLEDDDDE